MSVIPGADDPDLVLISERSTHDDQWIEIRKRALEDILRHFAPQRHSVDIPDDPQP